MSPLTCGDFTHNNVAPRKPAGSQRPETTETIRVRVDDRVITEYMVERVIEEVISQAAFCLENDVNPLERARKNTGLSAHQIGVIVAKELESRENARRVEALETAIAKRRAEIARRETWRAA